MSETTEPLHDNVFSFTEWYENYEGTGAGVPARALEFYAENVGYKLREIDNWISEAEESYVGEFPGREEFAYELASELGVLPENYSWPQSYIDWDKAARDLFIGGDYWDEKTGDYTIYVFRSI